MQISKRLTAVSEMVTSGYRLADIGTDHGYIPIYLILENRIPSAIAMDVNKGPLERADEHIAQYGLEGRIETRLSDGLERLCPGEADSILIAGMGGMLMVRILKNGEEAVVQAKELILQPQSDIREVRLYLKTKGYQITDENMIEEEGKFYPMMRAVLMEDAQAGPADTEHAAESWSAEQAELQLLYGPVLLKSRHPVLFRYLEREQVQMTKVADALRKENGEGARQRLSEIKEILRLNGLARSLYE